MKPLWAIILHYRVICNAFHTELRAVTVQKQLNELKEIEYVSWALTFSGQKYSQLESKAPSQMISCICILLYVFGKNFG